jgi:predicted outer membrane repeat protein
MAAQQAVCERYHIIASPSDPCPGERNGEFCFTLQEFITRSFISQHLTLELEPGIHALESPLHNVIALKSSLEIIGHNATIKCPPYDITTWYMYNRFELHWFQFLSIEQLSISGVTFIDCHSIYLDTVYNATISGSRFEMQLSQFSIIGLELRTTNVTIHSCTFIGLGTGIHLYSSNSSINSCNFFGNRKGINSYTSYDQPSNCIIYRSVFINNNAYFGGGAISADDNVAIVDSIFAYNTAPQCAVFSSISWRQLNLTIESSIFLYNQATNSTAEDDNMRYLGGVACVRGISLVANNCTFSHNSAKHNGGVLHAEDSNVTITNSSFHNNSAGIDGGVLYTYLLPSTFFLTGCSFTNNRAGDDGGAIYIGKTRSTLDIVWSLFSHNIANDRGGAIIVFGSTIGMEQTDMHSNQATSGDDIGVCTASNITGPSTYFTYFQQRTYSTPTTECLFYGRLTRIFHILTPEDHSNINLAQYLEISNQYDDSSDHNGNLLMATTTEVSTGTSVSTSDDSSDHNDNLLMATTTEVSTGTTYVGSTNPERELLQDLRNKISEASSVQYVILAISLLFVTILVIVIAMKFKTVCVKKKARDTEHYDLDKRNTSNEYNDHNESAEIYEEPVWKDDQPDAIDLEVKPDAGYAKHLF